MLPLRDTLGYLHREFAAPIPEGALRRIEAVPEDNADAVRDGLLTKPHTLLEVLRMHRWRYAQVARGRGERTTPMGFLDYYMQTEWRLRRRWHALPRSALAVARALLFVLGVKKL